MTSPAVFPTPRTILLDGQMRAGRAGDVVGDFPDVVASVTDILRSAPEPRTVVPVTLKHDVTLADQHYRVTIPAAGPIVAAASSRSGFLYAAQTILALTGPDGIATGTIDDAPAMRDRGVFIESFWGSDLMRLADWQQMIDRLAFLKFNVIGMSVYGCWDLRHDGDRGEYLMVPVPGFDKLATPHAFRRWDESTQQLRTVEYLPAMFEDDTFRAVVAYAATRGIEVIPFVAGPGHSSLIPRHYPAMSARDADGEPTLYGYCLSAPEARAELVRFFTALIDGQFAPAGVTRIGVQADEFFPIRNVLPEDPDRVLTPYCECAGCAELGPGGLLLAYLDLIGEIAHAANMGMVHWHDSLHREGVFDRYGELLKQRPGRDVTISWWGYNDPLPVPQAHAAWQTWVTPTPGLIASLLPQDFTLNIEQWMQRGRACGARGVLAYNTYQPAQVRNYVALADAAWAGERGGGRRGFLERWSARGADAEATSLADDLLTSVFGSYPLMNYLLQQTLPYFAVSSGPAVHYAHDLLRTLATPFPALTSVLRQARDTVAEALAVLPTQPPLGPWGDIDHASRVELRRVIAHLDLVLEAVRIVREAARGLDVGERLDAFRADGIHLLNAIANESPSWLAPITTREHAELIQDLPDLVARIRAGEDLGFDAREPWHAWLF